MRLYEASGKSMRTIEQELGITPYRLSKWVQQFREQEAAARSRNLAAGARYPKKSSGHLLGAKTMRYQFIQAYQDEFSVQRMCSVLGVSPSGYYAWQSTGSGQPETDAGDPSDPYSEPKDLGLSQSAC